MKALLIVLSVVLPFIGSGGHGHVFVGADVPHGAIHAGPMNLTQGWDWCSGYHSSDTTLAGFAQTRLGGTGVADYGDIVILPQVEPSFCASDSFSKSSEIAYPGYYELTTGSGIRVQITASDYCALYRFTFPKGARPCLKIDLKRGAQSLMFRKAFDSGDLRLCADGRSIEGNRVSSEWTFAQPVWFKAEFSSKVLDIKEEDSVYLLSLEGSEEILEMKLAISQKSASALASNLKDASSFGKTLKKAQKAWDRELSKIEFEAFDPVVDSIFYTALYHTATSPQLFSDRGEPKTYSIFSLWDTYRAVHPLYNLIDPRAAEYCNSLLEHFDRTSRLPVWLLGDRETDCMVGIHSISVLCEAALKAVKGVDPQRVLKACSTMLSQPTYGMELWDEYGYLPADKVNWSVSVELEYCISAESIALLAEKIGEKELAYEFHQRAQRYRRHFDAQSGFMRGVDSKGQFTEPFDPAFSLHEEADYVEGNAWQYSFLVPEDVEGLASLYGGADGLKAKLDALFSADSALNEGASADITGMIGQYAHGNEPSHHIIYLYSLLGDYERAGKYLRKVYDDFYSTADDGLIGNEDCGQMSAWYVFSALGFYPVFPADGRYVFGLPLCRKAKVHLLNGRCLEIRSNCASGSVTRLGSVRFNGKILDRPYTTHEELMKGGLLEYELL
ncbi:MAG: GH92 family glycosyl hydrolase [Candidatus Cryptobacteroides sp.]